MNILQKIKNWPGDGSDNNYSFAISKGERDEFCSTIINSSSLQPGFYFLLAISAFITSVGLIRDSVILLVGGMLVAPMLSPVLAVSLSLTIVNFRVLIRSILIFIISTLASLLVTVFIGVISDFNLVTINFIQVMNIFSPATLLVPIAAGGAASFAWAKKNVIGALPGAAVTVTLLPPIAAMGLALGDQSYQIFRESLYIYLLNVGGIIIGGLIVFILMGFYKSRKKVVKEVEEEVKNEE
ncbi:MAG: DUF389 domain-containing protein [Patescibacteria group bacterium]|jgi:uncharacterized hydrophobic protein (TIGR00271 family)|nr:DUF389 domain-containing protein [Patescibacteria group bacterium]